MHVARDDVRQEAFLEHGAGDVEIERTHAVADVEPDAPLARLQDLGADVAPAVQGALGNGLKQWVSTSPWRRRLSTSLRDGGG